jgi:hypothetical protein
MAHFLLQISLSRRGGFKTAVNPSLAIQHLKQERLLDIGELELKTKEKFYVNKIG